MSDLQQIGIKTSDKSEGYGNKCMGTMLENMYVHPSLVHEDEFDKDRCRLVGGNWLPWIWHFPINIGLLSSSQLTNSYFSEGWPWPTNQINQWYIWCRKSMNKCLSLSIDLFFRKGTPKNAENSFSICLVLWWIPAAIHSRLALSTSARKKRASNFGPPVSLQRGRRGVFCGRWAEIFYSQFLQLVKFVNIFFKWRYAQFPLTSSTSGKTFEASDWVFDFFSKVVFSVWSDFSTCFLIRLVSQIWLQTGEPSWSITKQIMRAVNQPSILWQVWTDVLIVDFQSGFSHKQSLAHNK